ncbi:uncharacterized protein LOC110911182 [Helianthus annuus]|uniref:DUF674 family protein n=1 Tax=Helianthus annuus TaxID=4232 RepID=A0A251S5U9_HELAN|nr:uncharacterized protein LOC110911182 [Helianthus annuus]
MATSKVTLKLFINKKEQRVLFAEASKDFIDFLFSLLVLPVGTVIKLSGNQHTLDGLAKLYESVSDLDNDYIQPNKNKDIILKPTSSVLFFSPHEVPLLPAEAFSKPSRDDDSYEDGYYYHPARRNARERGFVMGLVKYMVMDDLGVSPMPTFSTLLNKFIKDLDALEEKVINIGMNEGLELLKHSLNSKTVLTDVFLGEVIILNENMKRPKSSRN